MISYALRYLEMGMSVFPLQPKSKIPFFSWQRWSKERPSRAQVIKWWAQCPSANIAVCTGEVSGLFVVDCDDQPIALAHTNQPDYFPTYSVRTRKGMHFYHGLPDFHVGNRTNLLGSGQGEIDVRGDGGYVVAPPSIHPSGTHYTLNEELPFAQCPKYILDLLRPQITPAKPVNLNVPLSNHWQRILEREARSVACAVDGTINNTLNKAAYNLGQLVGDGLLGRTEVENILFDTAVQRGETESRARRTIRSGLDAGTANPRSRRGRG